MILRILLVTLYIASCSLFAMVALTCLAFSAVKLATIIGIGTLIMILMSGLIIEAHYSPMDDHYGDI